MHGRVAKVNADASPFIPSWLRVAGLERGREDIGGAAKLVKMTDFGPHIYAREQFQGGFSASFARYGAADDGGLPQRIRPQVGCNKGIPMVRLDKHGACGVGEVANASLSNALTPQKEIV